MGAGLADGTKRPCESGSRGGGGGGSALFLGSPRLAALFLQLPTCIVAFLQKQVEIKLGRWLPIAHGVNLNEVKMCFC